MLHPHAPNIDEPVIYPYMPEFVKHLYKKYCKNFYIVQKPNSSKPHSEQKWQLIIGSEFINWSNIQNDCFRITNDTNLQWFQYRLLHQILPLRKYLKKIQVIDYDLCTLCGDEEETIQDLFYYCHKSQDLWDCVKQWIFNKTNINIDFTIENILFGEHKNIFNPLNFIVMNTKYYIISVQRKDHLCIFLLIYYAHFCTSHAFK